MPDLRADEIITLKHKRSFIQFGGARPNNTVRYGGQNAQYMAIDGLSISETGGIDPIYVPHPTRQGAYKLVGRAISAPDLASASIIMREKHGVIPRQLTRIGCQFNFYELTGACGDLSDFLSGWTDYVLIYSGAIVTDKDGGTRTAWDNDAPIETTLSVTLADVYPIGALSFGEGAVTNVDREVIDIVYRNAANCGDCGPAVDGASQIYAVTKSSGSGSPGLPAEIQYTLDGGGNWVQADIAGIGATEDPVGIDVVGNYLVVLAGTTAIPAYYVAEINKLTGVPGAFVKVTAGFVANHRANDIYVAGPREIYFCADGGYIYKSENILSGVTILNNTATANDLKRIRGLGEVIVASGVTGTVVKSVNRGATFATTTTAPSASATFQALEVLDNYRFWLGDNGGYIYKTLDGGETWSVVSYGESGTGQVYDIVFPTQEVGYVAYANATPAGKIMATWDGGADWTTQSPRILNMPTYDRPNRVAYPIDDAGVSANNIAVAGLAGDALDGIILVAVASKL